MRIDLSYGITAREYRAIEPTLTRPLTLGGGQTPPPNRLRPAGSADQGHPEEAVERSRCDCQVEGRAVFLTRLLWA